MHGHSVQNGQQHACRQKGQEQTARKYKDDLEDDNLGQGTKKMAKALRETLKR